MRDEAKTFPTPVDPLRVTTVRVWHCRYRSLRQLESLRNLCGADIASLPDDTLDVFGDASSLTYLSVLHLPKVSDLSPLAKFKALETLRLSTLPSWDSSRKRTRIRSLTPLLELPSLRYVELFSVVPDDGSLHDLAAHSALRSVRLLGYGEGSVRAFRAASGVSDDPAPQPWF